MSGEDANGFFLSSEAMIDLAIAPQSFPSVGSAANDLEQQLHGHKVTDNYRSLNTGCSEPSSNPESPCTRPVRTVVPYRPKDLPFSCVPANNDRMVTADVCPINIQYLPTSTTSLYDRSTSGNTFQRRCFT